MAGLEALALSVGEHAGYMLAELVCLAERAEREQIVERPPDRAGVIPARVHPVVEDEREHFVSLRRTRDRNAVFTGQDDDVAPYIADEDVLPFVDGEELVSRHRVLRSAEPSKGPVAAHVFAAGPEEQTRGERLQAEVEILGDDPDHDTSPVLVTHQMCLVVARQLLGLARHHLVEYADWKVLSADAKQHTPVLGVVLRRSIAQPQLRVSRLREHHGSSALRSTFRERIRVYVMGHSLAPERTLPVR